MCCSHPHCAPGGSVRLALCLSGSVSVCLSACPSLCLFVSRSVVAAAPLTCVDLAVSLVGNFVRSLQHVDFPIHMSSLILLERSDCA